ncbi:KamA family radical SAM protein [Dickeya undicola]|uniref:KamA family radical SAM protein n=1 Tax=Dickeya undicola TaxID=1577887 RepID=A0ABX9WPR4_9GAMM|nr:KamA family radical SAM protein [Dickeya undicola]RNM19617.1 KamA family radical SAM protein [Dickeya undicola]
MDISVTELALFPVEERSRWTDWRWQQKNAIRDEPALRAACGGWSEEVAQRIVRNLNDRKMQITPYYADLIRQAAYKDIVDNPLWRQVVPFWHDDGVTGYDGESENWELSHEMKTPICQHKYDNRVILRMVNTCNSYCQFCFEALRTLKVDSEKENAGRKAFQDSLDYIRTTPEVEEVILSGGDPMMLTDAKLDECLGAIRNIRDSLLIRIHSRSLTFNPYRITDNLLDILRRHRVNAFGVHVCHPLELSGAFRDAVKRIQQVVPIVFSNMPLLRGVNDNEETLKTLFIELYRMGVKPYYLYHFMPFSPGASEYKASIRDAIAIMNRLKRRVSNIALPEYVLPHAKGKFTVPLLSSVEEIPQFEDIDGTRFYRFTNWQGDVCRWQDS